MKQSLRKLKRPEIDRCRFQDECAQEARMDFLDAITVAATAAVVIAALVYRL